MKKTTPQILLLAATLALSAGCAHVPATTIAFNPRKHQIEIRSPKDIEITNLIATFSQDGSAEVKVDSYRARNSVEVIQAIAQQNIEMTKAVGEIGAKVVGEAVSKIK